jgi:hypothetical protein
MSTKPWTEPGLSADERARRIGHAAVALGLDPGENTAVVRAAIAEVLEAHAAEAEQRGAERERAACAAEVVPSPRKDPSGKALPNGPMSTLPLAWWYLGVTDTRAAILARALAREPAEKPE